MIREQWTADISSISLLFSVTISEVFPIVVKYALEQRVYLYGTYV
jgi:hypothetical protein